jgi:hypothetical protein
MGSHDPFEHMKHKLWQKEGPWVKLTVWLPTTKSQESPRFPCVQVMCDISLKGSRQGLQLCFRPHFNRKFAHKVMGPQSWAKLWQFRDPTWESPDKKPFGCGPHGGHKIYYKGEGGGFPQVRAVVSLVSPNLPVVHLSTKSAPIMH